MVAKNRNNQARDECLTLGKQGWGNESCIICQMQERVFFVANREGSRIPQRLSGRKHKIAKKPSKTPYLLVCPVPRRQRLHRRVRPLPPAGLEGRRAVGDEAGGGWLQDEAKEEEGGGEDEAWWRRAHGTSPFFLFVSHVCKNGEKEVGEFVKLGDVSIRVHAFSLFFFAREKLH